MNVTQLPPLVSSPSLTKSIASTRAGGETTFFTCLLQPGQVCPRVGPEHHAALGGRQRGLSEWLGYCVAGLLRRSGYSAIPILAEEERIACSSHRSLP